MSKTAKRASTSRLREFRRTRKIVNRIVIALLVLFVAAVAVNGVFLPQATWLPVIAVFLYVGGFLVLRQVSKCPYCDEPIMSRFNSLTHCPHCGKVIDPDYTGK